MNETGRKYICINCGKEVQNLFKKYSATVLKLTNCENCHNVADKYVEYDVVIIIIDLVLLQKIAYRHILFNVDFKNFWKLTIILLLMEAYSELMRNSPEQYVKNEDEEPFLNEFDEMADFQFYKISLKVAIKTTCFIVVLYLLTVIYCKTLVKNSINFMMVWKSLTVSSFGIFLLLPSLIWDTSAQEFHLCVVSLYTTMSQLLAYTAMCDCPKIWSIVAIFCAYYCKSFCFEFVDILVFMLQNITEHYIFKQ